MIYKPREAGSVVRATATRLVVPVQNTGTGSDAIQRRGQHGARTSHARGRAEHAVLHRVVPKGASRARPVQVRQPVQASHVILAAQTGLPVPVLDARAVRDAVGRGGRGHAEQERDSAGELHAGGGGELARLNGVVPHERGSARPVREHDGVDAADVDVATRAGLVVVVGEARA